jgi:hypothetical protein
MRLSNHQIDNFRRAATYADRILKGAKTLLSFELRLAAA